MRKIQTIVLLKKTMWPEEPTKQLQYMQMKRSLQKLFPWRKKHNKRELARTVKKEEAT